MAIRSRKIRIVGALVAAGVLIIVAFVVSSPSFTLTSIFTPATANAESTQDLLQAYAQKDSDGDGLPDWEEALYGTDPHNAHSFSPTLTDGQAVAEGLIKPKIQTQPVASSTDTIDSSLPGVSAASGTMTDQFAQNLFSQYLSQEGGANPSTSDIDTFAQQAMQQEVQNHSHVEKYSLSDLKVSGTGASALTSYAVAADAVLSANEVSTTKSEIDYFSDAMEKNNISEYSQVADIGNAYTAMATGFVQIPVPIEAENAQLQLVNAMSNLGEDITDMSTGNSDPLRAYIGLQQYEVDVPQFTRALTNFAQTFIAENVSIPQNESGGVFYREVLEAGAVQTQADEASSTPPQ